MLRLSLSLSCVAVTAERPPEATDHDVVTAQQTKLLLLSRRLCGVTVGRGMVTMSTLPVTLTEPLRIPVLSLAARVPPTDAVITLDTSTVRPTGLCAPSIATEYSFCDGWFMIAHVCVPVVLVVWLGVCLAMCISCPTPRS